MKTTTLALLLAAALAPLPLRGPGSAALAAQERPGATPLPPCTEGRMLGSLGITGLRCNNCSFSSSRGVVLEARFDTEPEILAVDGDSPLRAGDVLVAVDGELITTREGARALTSVGPTQTVRLRVRRDGDEREVRVRAIPSCLRGAMPEPPEPPSSAAAPRPRAAPGPLPPSSAAEPMPPVQPGAPLPALAPTPPALSEMRPDARLGFGFECDDCSYSGRDGRWRFEAHPVVYRVEPGGPAAGLLRSGDRLLAVDGADLTTEAGGRAFSGIRTGDDVRWTVVRDGARRDVVTRAEAKARNLVPAAPAAPEPRTPAAPDPRTPAEAAAMAESAAAEAVRRADELALYEATRPDLSILRYAGNVGATDVEVRGEPVTVTREGNVLVVRTRGNEIRIVVGEGG